MACPMLGSLLLIAQAAADALVAPGAPSLPRFTDPPKATCPPATSGELVVCARPVDQAHFRLQPTQPAAASALPKADVTLPGGAHIAAHGQSVGHYSAPAFMVTLRVPF